jgi:hypothetical protein
MSADKSEFKSISCLPVKVPVLSATATVLGVTLVTFAMLVDVMFVSTACSPTITLFPIERISPATVNVPSIVILPVEVISPVNAPPVKGKAPVYSAVTP